MEPSLRSKSSRFQKFMMALALSSPSAHALRGCGGGASCNCLTRTDAGSDAQAADAGELQFHAGACTAPELAAGCTTISQGAGPLDPPELA